MAEHQPTVVEQLTKAHWESTGGQWPDMRSDRKDMLVKHMLAALELLQEVLFEQFDGHAEPSDAVGILIARHQAGVDEKEDR